MPQSNDIFPSFEQFIESKQYGSRKRQKALKDAKILISKSLPVVLNFDHLAEILTLPPITLGAMVNSSESFYRSFTIPKKSGGLRSIEAPYPLLLETQQWILKNILNKISISSCAHGFTSERSIVTHAAKHLPQNSLLKIDIKHFFPSISKYSIYYLFRSIGYSKGISYIFSEICCKEDHLPQGAATSPMLSNIFLKEMDRELLDFAIRNNIIYTRYADDLAFSGDEINNEYINHISSILYRHGFVINDKKTRIYSEKSKKIITGIELSGGKLSIPRKKKRELRKEIYFLSKFGLLNHLTKIDKMDPIYLERILGKLGFWKFVEPESSFVNSAIESINDLRKSDLDHTLIQN